MTENKNLTLADDEKLTLEMKTFQMVGVDDYNALLNRPKINGVEVSGEKALDDYDVKKKSEANAEHNEIKYAISTETNRAENAEKANYDAISTETAERKAADSALENLIITETNRAENAEKANSDVITAHIVDNNNPHGVTVEQINALSLIPTKEITQNEDLNDIKYTRAGVYACKSDDIAKTIKNKPTEVTNAFVLTVYKTIYGWLVQEIKIYYNWETFYRTAYTQSQNDDRITVYKDWGEIYSDVHKPTINDIGLTAITNSEIDTIVG